MSPRIVPQELPLRHEDVALKGIHSEAAIETASTAKRESRFDDAISPRWLRVATAVKYSGINRSRLFRLIAEGVVKTACLKERPKAKRGLRLIDRWSLDLYLERLSKPIEEQLVQQFNELQLQEETLTKQRELLLEKQGLVERKLAEIRKGNLDKIA